MEYISVTWTIFATSKFWQSNKDVNPDYIACEESSTELIAFLSTLEPTTFGAFIKPVQNSILGGIHSCSSKPKLLTGLNIVYPWIAKANR